MLARVIGDEETRRGLQLLRRFRDVAQLEVRDLAGEREIARAVEQTAVVAIATSRQNEGGDFNDLISLRTHLVEHHQLLKDSVRWEFVRGDIGKGEIADFLAGLGVFEKFQSLGFIEPGEITPSFVGLARLPVAEVPKSFKARCTGRHPLGAELLKRKRVPRNVEELVVTYLLPVLKSILVKQVEEFGDLRLAKHLFVLLRRSANHPRHERCRGRQMIRREWQSFSVEVIKSQVVVRRG